MPRPGRPPSRVERSGAVFGRRGTPSRRQFLTHPERSHLNDTEGNTRDDKHEGLKHEWPEARMAWLSYLCPLSLWLILVWSAREPRVLHPRITASELHRHWCHTAAGTFWSCAPQLVDSPLVCVAPLRVAASRRRFTSPLPSPLRVSLSHPLPLRGMPRPSSLPPFSSLPPPACHHSPAHLPLAHRRRVVEAIRVIRDPSP